MNTKNNMYIIGLIAGMFIFSLVVSGVAMSSSQSISNASQMASMSNPPLLWIVAGEPSDILVQNRLPESFLAAAPQTANITVTYVGTWDPQAKTAFEYAVSIWETQITSSMEIKVEATWENLGAGVLGGAGAEDLFRDFANAPVSGTWYPVALANKLAGTDLSPGSVDIGASFNSAFSSWYFGIDGNPPTGKYDFASVVLHEIGHGLGFFGSMSVDTNSSGDCGGVGLGCWGFGFSPTYPAIYDRFTENGAGTALLGYPNNSTSLATQLTSNNIYFDGPNANLANGNSRVPLYTPGTWQQGSSYSHLAESFNGSANALMTFSIGPNEVQHAPGQVMLGMFQDMGWMIDNAATATPTPTATPLPVEATIEPETGGILTFTDYEANDVTIHVPENAVSQTISLLYTPLGKQTPPEGLAFAGTAFTLDAYLNNSLLPGFVFSRPVTITLEYSNSDIFWVESEESVKLYTLTQPDGWDDAVNTCSPPSTYTRDEDQNWVETQICHLSRFSLFGDKKDTYLPIVSKPDNWITNYSDSFEGNFPGSWTLFDFGPNTGYVWGKRNCQVYQGSFAAWGVGGGAKGQTHNCNQNYPNNVETWMRYGPFNLTGKIAAELNFQAWVNLEPDFFDQLCFIASGVGGTNPQNYEGYCLSGNSNGWTSKTLNLANIYGDGSVKFTGDSSVWVAFVFFSDESLSFPGAAIDNIVIQSCASGCTTLLNSQTSDENLQVIPWRDIQFGVDNSK